MAMASPSASAVAPGRPGRRLRVLPVACVGFAALGLREASLGVAWPSVRATFGQPLAALGVVLLAGTAGYLVSSLASGRLAAALGHRRLLIGASLIGVVGLVVVTAAPAWAGFVTGMAVLGVSGGLVDAGLNTVVAVGHGVRGLGFLHAAFGAGAVLGPLLMAVVVAGPGSWRLGYGVLLMLYVVVVAGFVLSDLGAAPDAPVQPEPTVAVPSAHRAALVCAVALFFVYVGVEATAGQWAFSLFTEVQGMGDVAAGAWLGAFWAGFTAVRVLTGLAGHRVGGVLLLDGSVLMAALGAGLLWWSPVAAVGGMGLVLLGVGLGAVFPTLVALTPQRMGAGRTSQAIGYQVGAAAVGAAVLPALFGVLAEEAGLDLLGPVLLAGVGALVILHRVAVVLERR